jgi:hypothetical protein
MYGPIRHDSFTEETTGIKRNILLVDCKEFIQVGCNGILRRCVLEHEKPMILEEVHDGIAGGDYAGRETAKNILCEWIWWTKLQKDDKEYGHSCDVCQRVETPSRRDEMPLNP